MTFILNQKKTGRYLTNRSEPIYFSYAYRQKQLMILIHVRVLEKLDLKERDRVLFFVNSQDKLRWGIKKDNSSEGFILRKTSCYYKTGHLSLIIRLKDLGEESIFIKPAKWKIDKDNMLVIYGEKNAS